MSVRIRWHKEHNAYSLWDPEIGWIDKFGRASDSYYCDSREVAVMRRRDLNQYRKDREDSDLYGKRRRDERRSEPLLDVPPSPDIATLEAAAEALTRHNEIQHAIAVWAIVLRMRMETNR